MLLFLCRSDYARQTQGSLPSAIYGVQISVRVSSAGTFLSLIEPEPNYDHVLFSIDNRYLIIQLVTQTRSRTIPTIFGFREIHPGIIMLSPGQPVVVKFLSNQDFILPPSLSSLSCRLWRIWISKKSCGRWKRLNESGITPNKVIWSTQTTQFCQSLQRMFVQVLKLL